MDLKSKIRDIVDFPQKGIIYRDITTLLKDAEALKYAVDEIKKNAETMDYNLVLGPESRGFIFGVPIAYATNKGFVPVRKAGKLPHEVASKEYSLEYGTATIEIHKDAINKGDKIIIVDDLFATGGTAKATCDLVEEMGGIVSGIFFLIELEGLGGRELLKDYEVKSIVKY